MKAYIQGFQKMYTCYGVEETGILENEGQCSKIGQKWPKIHEKMHFWPKFDEKS